LSLALAEGGSGETIVGLARDKDENGNEANCGEQEVGQGLEH